MSSVISSSSASALQPRVGEQSGDPRGEAAIAQIAPRHVDGDEDVVPGGPPRGALRQRDAQHRLREQLHQPGLLGEDDELGGRDQAPLGMLPADERLEALDAAVRDVDDRLVVDDQLVVLDRPLQLADQRAGARASSGRARGCRAPAGAPACPRTSPRRPCAAASRCRSRRRDTARCRRCPWRAGSGLRRSNGCSSSPSRRLATRCASPVSATGMTRPNSSPPRRAIVSLARSDSCRRLATSTRKRSPFSWPRVSLISLNLSRSSSMIAELVAGPRGTTDRVLCAVVEEHAVREARQAVVERDLLRSRPPGRVARARAGASPDSGRRKARRRPR